MSYCPSSSSSTSPLELQAQRTPDDIAYRLIPSNRTVTWGELELRSRKLAAAMQAAGLRPGDGIALMLENHLRYFEILWAAQRSGLYYTPISRHLKMDELVYIVRDCGAKMLFCSDQTLADLDQQSLRALPAQCVLLDPPTREGFADYEALLAAQPDDVAINQDVEGLDFCYSSGTTGLPKGIKRPLAEAGKHFAGKGDARTHWKDFDEKSVYLSTAPFYHTAPVRWNMAVMRAGGQCVMMEKFDAELALEAIERFRVTHGQWVPTMFIRLLRLPDAVKTCHDLSSMRYAIHAAAPCPAAVKEQMIDWWGPILYEYYSGTELVGRTSLDSHEWLHHKGSVGKAEIGQVHIVDALGRELVSGEDGVVYFSGGPRFEYYNDPEKTAQAYNDRGWATYGDIGHMDSEGYLYLTDRLANTIVSGGVNIYPQEAENVLQGHPAVADVAVIGVPNTDFGEEVKAVVQLQAPYQGDAQLEAELVAYCRERLSSIKCPRSVDFVQTLPRAESGKLLKRLVKAQYWDSAQRIAH